MDHYISTQFRNDGTDTDFTYDLSIPPDHTHVTLRTMSLPKTYYNVENGSNTFIFNTFVYTVPEGYYSVSDLRRTLNTLLGVSCTVTYSKLTGKFTFTSVIPGPAPIIFPSTSRLFRPMGFNEASTNNFSGTILVSVNVCNLSAIEECYVICDMVRDECLSTGFANLLCIFPTNSTQDLSLVTYENPNPEIGGKLLTLAKGRTEGGRIHVRFRILNENGYTLNLNGHPLTMSIHTYKEEPDMYMLLREMSNYLITYLDEQRLISNATTQYNGMVDGTMVENAQDDMAYEKGLDTMQNTTIENYVDTRP